MFDVYDCLVLISKMCVTETVNWLLNYVYSKTYRCGLLGLLGHFEVLKCPFAVLFCEYYSVCSRSWGNRDSCEIMWRFCQFMNVLTACHQVQPGELTGHCNVFSIFVSNVIQLQKPTRKPSLKITLTTLPRTRQTQKIHAAVNLFTVSNSYLLFSRLSPVAMCMHSRKYFPSVIFPICGPVPWTMILTVEPDLDQVKMNELAKGLAKMTRFTFRKLCRGTHRGPRSA